jgi:putative MFS transporter
MLSVDELFDTRIGLGRAQYTSILCLCLIDMNDGAQLVLSSFLNPIVKREWGLSSGQVQNMSSIFYLGTLFGSLLSGKFSDYYGRRPIIIGGSVLQFIMCCAFAFVSSYGQMLLARFLYGFTFGLTIVLTTSMYSEIVPTYYRGKGLLLINFCVSLGKVLSLILAYIFLDNFNEGDWKSMMMASSLPSLIVVAGAYFRMYESPRFLLAKGSYD